MSWGENTHLLSTLGLPDGRGFVDQQVTEAGRWIHYPFSNPVTGDEGVTHTWVVRHDGAFIGSGWYE